VLLMLHQQRTDPESDLFELTKLIETLKDLKVLHEKFKFRIKLADFYIDNKAEVSAVILDWFQVIFWPDLTFRGTGQLPTSLIEEWCNNIGQTVK
jgi:hypothetical protein